MEGRIYTGDCRQRMLWSDVFTPAVPVSASIV